MGEKLESGSCGRGRWRLGGEKVLRAGGGGRKGGSGLWGC